MTTILAVCTGNVCRSPAMEAMLKNGTDGLPGLAGLGIDVGSAGLRALVGSKIDPKMVSAVGASMSGTDDFVARQVDADMLQHASLVVTATRRQRASVVSMVPAVRDKSFTLAEFARYCDTFTASHELSPPVAAVHRLAELVEYASFHRGSLVPPRLDDDDVADPYRRSMRVHRRAAASIAVSTRSILVAVSGAPRHGDP